MIFGFEEKSSIIGISAKCLINDANQNPLQTTLVLTLRKMICNSFIYNDIT